MSGGGWMQKAGFDDQTIIDNVVAKNATFNPPLDDKELNLLLHQILKLPKRARTYGLTTEQLAIYSRWYFLDFVDHLISSGKVKGFVLDVDEDKGVTWVETLPLFLEFAKHDCFEAFLSDMGAEERYKKSNEVLSEINSVWLNECFGKESK
jgi:hypothetical protein